MAVTRKPKSAAPGPASEAAVEALIQRGGSVGPAGNGNPEREKSAAVVLRIPPEILERVDHAVSGRRVRIPRHTWILEAIAEKLDRSAPEG